jgi:hypothetical protein
LGGKLGPVPLQPFHYQLSIDIGLEQKGEQGKPRIQKQEKIS